MRFTKILAIVFSIAAAMGGCTEDKGEPGSARSASEKTGVTSDLPAPVVTGAKVTFIELGSVNCVPCKLMQPVMKQVAGTFKDQVKVVFYDVWTRQGEPFGKQYRIRVIPTQVFLDAEGREFYRHEGFFPYEELVLVLQSRGVK